jgi:hypothetical protein
MKLSKIAFASLLAVGSAGSFAATYVVPTACSITKMSEDKAKFVNECTPHTTLYVAGSSALGGGISNVLKSVGTTTSIFESTPIEILDKGSKNGYFVGNIEAFPENSGGNGVTAFFGMSKAGLLGADPKPLFVVYNSFNGSAAGVSQVMASAKKEDWKALGEATVVAVGPTPANIASPCVIGDGNPVSVTLNTSKTIATTGKVICSNAAPLKADLAISDLDVPELAKLYTVAEQTKLKDLIRKPLGTQGFGIAVSNNLYIELAKAQAANGRLPSSCSSGAYSLDCQPNITSAEYASLISREAATFKTAGALGVPQLPLILARRDDLSGTQAASNLFFLNSCSKFIAGSTLGGALTPITNKAVDVYYKKVKYTIPADTTYTDLIIREHAQSGGVKDNLTTPGDNHYAIGVLTLAEADTTSFKFVKIDGQSPNFDNSQTTKFVKASSSSLTTSQLRKNMLNGSWPFQFTSYAVYPKAAEGTATKPGDKKELINRVILGLSDSTLTDLDAVGYFNSGASASKKTLVSRGFRNGPEVNYDAKNPKGTLVPNNCAPLIQIPNSINIPQS